MKSTDKDASVAELIEALPMNAEEDFLMALRYAYYVKHAPLIPDSLYDQLEREYLNRPEVEDSPLMQPGSDKEADYPRRIKALWLYLFAAREDQRPKDNIADHYMIDGTGDHCRLKKLPAAAPTAPPAPRKRPGRGKTAEKASEAAMPSLF